MIRVGTALGLSYVKLRNMRAPLADMVKGWLNSDDEVLKTSGPATWISLAIALDKTGHRGIASRIRKGKYLYYSAIKVMANYFVW